ncbi:heme-binding protein [Pandoraea sp.]|uniref:GlcG/HbpS family heme-binding protein n=1 Tax=Pandoraea sp. TaxID=1883445 RepID=UPI00121DE8E4|nr:heme-binding protein [Pandoraea sp.]TAL53269.1 MAG: heme-binding protein [Pandoraea sp.]TAM16636.1 MAG: heme-binding protein [Pandoraea sp.]
MKQIPTLEAADVRKILDAAQAEALAQQWNVSIAVVDNGAQLLGFLRLDGAAPLSAKIAVGKANTAAISRKESKFYEEVVKGGRTAFLSVPELVVLEGGVPILVDGQCIGAVGVSGVRSDQDAQVARAGIKALADAHGLNITL